MINYKKLCNGLLSENLVFLGDVRIKSYFPQLVSFDCNQKVQTKAYKSGAKKVSFIRLAAKEGA